MPPATNLLRAIAGIAPQGGAGAMLAMLPTANLPRAIAGIAPQRGA